MSDVRDRVIGVFADHFGMVSIEIALEYRFVEDLGADSLDVTELVMELEEEFDINIPDDISDKLKTVGQVVEYISALPKVAD